MTAGSGGPGIRALHELDALDKAVYTAVAGAPTPTIDDALRCLSNAADFSGIWIASAAVLAAVGGRRGRWAAASGLAAIGVTSAVVNVGVKRATPRRRPDRAGAAVPADRHVRMPSSTSFPSGHTASAFAFANAVGASEPLLALPLRLLAGAVGCSRVHTGVHYPGDVLIGALVGAATGEVVGTVADAVRRRHAPRVR